MSVCGDGCWLVLMDVRGWLWISVVRDGCLWVAMDVCVM